MEESILYTVRSMIGGEEEYSDSDPFNLDLIMYINSIFGILNQLGIGVEGFMITGPDETWSEFLEGSNVSLNEVQTYVVLRVRILFDPPTSSTVFQSINEMIKELTWRMTTKVEVTNVRDQM